MGGERVADRLIATGDDYREAGLRGGRKRFPVWQHDNQRLAAEDFFGHRGYPLDHPSLAEKIVSDEDAVRLEEVFDIDQRLLGKQVALEPDIGVSAVENQRVDERILDKVVFVLGGAQVVPPIVKMSADPRVGIGSVGIISDADALDNRIDLHRVDAAYAVAQGMADIVARSRADNQHIREWQAAECLP